MGASSEIPDRSLKNLAARHAVEPSRPVSGRYAIHRGHLLVLTDMRGRIRARGGGMFFHRTRFLSDLEFRVADKPPELASVTQIGSDRILAYYLAPLPNGMDGGPPGGRNGGGEVVKHGIEVEVEVRVTDRLWLEWRIFNHGLAEAELPLSWRLEADFADQAKASSGERRPAAGVGRTWSAGVLSLEWKHPKLHHAVRARWTGPEAFADAEDLVRTTIRLQARGRARVRLEVTPLLFGKPPRRAGNEQDTWRGGASGLVTGNRRVQRAWGRAVQDLASLILGQGEGEERFTPAAGSPHYIGLFGRDSLMTGLQTALLNPAMLRGALSLLGRWLAKDYDARYDAQPGKVLHQRQLSPLSLLGRNPFLHYYGDHSAPGLYLLGIAAAYAQSGDKDLLRAYLPRAREILAWLDRDGDLDGDGFYEYRTLAGPKGLKNQGWKDSEDAILYPDGAMVQDPIALCEIQGLYHAAKRGLAAALRTLGESGMAEQLDGEARELKQRFVRAFWMEEEGYLALALDPDKRPVRTIASNAGDCLCYGIVDADKAGRVAERLMRPDMFSGWGVRTLSTGHPAYNPLAYHLGSVWPFSNALTARGLKRYGLDRPLHRLAKALFDATRLFEMDKMPELFGGHPRDRRHPHPGLYPDACSPQAWSAGAMIALVHTLAGLIPVTPLGALIVQPSLPDWLPELTLTDLPLGSGRVDLRLLRQADGGCGLEVLANTSGLEVTGEPDGELAAYADTLV